MFYIPISLLRAQVVKRVEISQRSQGQVSVRACVCSRVLLKVCVRACVLSKSRGLQISFVIRLIFSSLDSSYFSQYGKTVKFDQHLLSRKKRKKNEENCVR